MTRDARRSGGLALLLVVLLSAVLALPAAAPPVQPMLTQGRAYDEGGSPLATGTPIRAFIDGVDYSNEPSVRNALGDFVVLTDGNFMTAQGVPDTPHIKEGADLSEAVIFAAGDFTAATGVFQEILPWSVGSTVAIDLHLGSAATTPAPVKIQAFVTQPAQGGNQFLFVCNPTAASVSLGDYFIEVDRLGTYHGPRVDLSGSLPASGQARVDLGASDYLNPLGDAVKLVYRNPGGSNPTAAGRDIVVDRVEINDTFEGTLYWEPGNTILSDAPAPPPGHILERISFCADTNEPTDFRLAVEPGLPANGAPTVSLTSPAQDQVVQGGTALTVAWTMQDDVFLASYLRVWVNVTYGGTNVSLLTYARGATSVTWTAPEVDVTGARVSVDVLDPLGEKATSTRTFHIVRQPPFANLGLIVGIIVAVIIAAFILFGYFYATRRMEAPPARPPSPRPETAQLPSPPTTEETQRAAAPEGKKICPRCATAVHERDWVCFFCGFRFPEPPT